MARGLTRREFLGTSAIAGAAILAAGCGAGEVRQPSAAVAATAEEAGWPALPPVKIHVVYVGLGGAWPKPDFDAKAEVVKFQAYLAALQHRMGDVEFVGGELIANNDKAAADDCRTAPAPQPAARNAAPAIALVPRNSRRVSPRAMRSLLCSGSCFVGVLALHQTTSPCTLCTARSPARRRCRGR